MSVCAVVGGQFGSEGKGLIVGHIAKDYDHHLRVGAANAGHTLYTVAAEATESSQDLMQKHVMQQVPCAAYANPNARLYVGPGALISDEIFERELNTWQHWRKGRGLPQAQVYVDGRAHVIQDRHIHQEAQSSLAERIGSTSTIAREGIGAAQAARAMRDESCVLAKDFYRGSHRDLRVADVPKLLRAKLRKGDPDRNHHLLLEGTQGYGLSNTTGDFPYITSRNTTAAGLCADAGIPPGHVDRVILVVRSYPIRVAGNSGPFHKGSQEISWEEIGVDPESERTTVTKLVRRVASFSMDQVVDAAEVNGATEIALTFADYLAPDLYGQMSGPCGPANELALAIEAATGVPVRYVGTGPHSVIDRHA